MSKIKGYDAIEDKQQSRQDPLSALIQQPPPPCEKFNCPLYAKCKAEDIACEAFTHYVSTSNAIDPHYRRELKDFFHGKVKRGRQMVWHRHIEASRENFEIAFAK